MRAEKILLIDADSKIPNLALMKISAYHKSLGHTVRLDRLNLPYYPQKKKYFYWLPVGYDQIYCSVIFEGNKKIIEDPNKEVIFGGTGVDLTTVLPAEIENCEPDYSLYPENDISYGFISRGCIRKCTFCKVPKKEGYIRQVANIKDIVRHKKVKFLDNNILALPNHLEILQEIVGMQIKCEFTQGLDIRLLSADNSFLLSKINYLGTYTFAFDDWRYLPIIESKLPLLDWRKNWQIRFFVYVHPDMPLEDTFRRIEYLKERKILPYLMRDKACWNSENHRLYTDLAAYCNQPAFFLKMSFEAFRPIHRGKRKKKN